MHKHFAVKIQLTLHLWTNAAFVEQNIVNQAIGLSRCGDFLGVGDDDSYPDV